MNQRDARDLAAAIRQFIDGEDQSALRASEIEGMMMRARFLCGGS